MTVEQVHSLHTTIYDVSYTHFDSLCPASLSLLPKSLEQYDTKQNSTVGNKILKKIVEEEINREKVVFPIILLISLNIFNAEIKQYIMWLLTLLSDKMATPI